MSLASEPFVSVTFQTKFSYNIKIRFHKECLQTDILCTPRLSNTASPAMFTFHSIQPTRELTGGKALLLTLTWQNPLSQIAPIISCVCSEAVCRMYYSACGIMGHNFVRFSFLIKFHSHWYRGRGWFFSGIRQNGDLSGPIWCCDSRWALYDKNWPWPWGGTVMVRLDDKKRPVKRPACHPGSRVLLIQGRGTHTYRTIL